MPLVEQPHRLAFADRFRENVHRHVGTAPWTIDRKEAQASGRQSVEMAIGMRHQLIGLFRRRIEADRMIDIVVYGKRQARVGSIDRTGGGEDEVVGFTMLASFQNIEESGEIGIGVLQRVTDTGLRGKMHHRSKFAVAKYGLYALAIGEIDLVKTEVVEFAENGDARVLQRRINAVEAHYRAPSLQ